MGMGRDIHVYGVTVELKEIEILNTVSRPMTPLRFRWVFIYLSHRKAGVWSSYVAKDLHQDAMIQPRQGLVNVLIESVDPFKDVTQLAQVAAKDFVTLKWVAQSMTGNDTYIVGIELHSSSEIFRAHKDGGIGIKERDCEHDNLFHFGKG